MQVTDARQMNAVEIAALMKKRAFDEVELSPRIQAGTDAMFGRHMTLLWLLIKLLQMYVLKVMKLYLAIPN